MKPKIIPYTSENYHRIINKTAKETSEDWLLIYGSPREISRETIDLIDSSLSENLDTEVVCLAVYDPQPADEATVQSVKNQEIIALKDVLSKLISPLKLTEGFDLPANDFLWVVRRDMLVLHPYPEFEGENYVPFMTAINRIGFFGGTILLAQEGVVSLAKNSGPRLDITNHKDDSPKGVMLYVKDLCGYDELGFFEKIRILPDYWDCRMKFDKKDPQFSLPKKVYEDSDPDSLVPTEFMVSFKVLSQIARKLRK